MVVEFEVEDVLDLFYVESLCMVFVVWLVDV